MVHYYDVEKAARHLTEHAEKTSHHQCAKYVRQAIKAGGVRTYFHPQSACDYDSFLPKLGFREVGQTNYSPQEGDIIVIESLKGHEHGHIAMYNGKQWVSDFVQRDMFGGQAYRKKGVEYHIFRRETGWGIRKLF